ncbi:hypothetical protein EDD85DRAFT_962401 [Armillaria nabsnona]|nr:hypothetical protein EDD85DRAFT_962401 [Armillaria nabsnona]
MSDFSSLSAGESSGAYDIITGASVPVAIDATFAAKYKVGNPLPDFKMLDLRGEAPRKRVSRHILSSINRLTLQFGRGLILSLEEVTLGGTTSEAYKVGSLLSDDRTPASDHRTVCADVAI